MAGKLEKEPVFCEVVDAVDGVMLPHVFDDTVFEALLQSMPEFCWLLLVYEGVVVGDIMLFMLIVGLACC
jgi:hypothetical protein